MKLTIDNKIYSYNKFINLPVVFNKYKELFYIISKVWPWALTFVMFYGLAVLGLRCF